MFIDAPDEADVTEEVAVWYQQQRDAWGYLPNYAAAFAPRPNVAQAWNALNNAVRGNMDRRRFELATIAAARAYRSTYCLAAHSKFLRDVCDDEPTMRALAADPTGAGLEPADQAVLHFATRLAQDASSVTAEDVDELREHGLSDIEIADVVFAVSARAFFTKVLDGLGVQADFQLGQTFDSEVRGPVSYTHLTLPTILRV